jgi:predicted PurR-regulated permease PerM
MTNYKDLPFYIQFTIKLLMLLLLAVFITYGENVVIPFVFSILLSILLLPVTNFFEQKLRLPRSISNLIAVIFALALIASLIYFISNQVASFLQEMPEIKSRLQKHTHTLQVWIQQKFKLSSKEQSEVISSATDVSTTGPEFLGQTVFTITQTFFYIILVAIYSFLILFYRHMIKRFIIAIFVKVHADDVQEVLKESKVVVQKYMLGLVTEMGIIAVLNSTVLFLIGIKYALFLGILSAILNIIPYVGIISGIIITCLVTLTTSPYLSDIIWIIVSFEVIHFFDSNFLMPRIVGSKVKINALVTILGVVIGGTLAGLSGIFLALPVIAILKIIFDRIDELKPWGVMMGDDNSVSENKIYTRLRNIRRKKTG